MACILIVDDREDVRQAVGMVLRHEGHEVLSASEGADALMQMRERHGVDILIADLRMKPMHGLEVIIRTRQEFPMTAVIAVSAFKDHLMVEKVLELGCACFVDKPLTMAKLVGPIREILATAGKGPPVDECKPIGDEDIGSLDDMDWVL